MREIGFYINTVMIFFLSGMILFSYSPEVTFEYSYPYEGGISSGEYKSRRDLLKDSFGEKSAAIFFSGDFYGNRHPGGNNKDMFYLSGVAGEKAVFLLIPGSFSWKGKICREVLFLEVQDEGDKVWNGVKMPFDYASKNLGINMVLSLNDYKEFTDSLLKNIDTLYINGITAARNHLEILKKPISSPLPVLDDLKEKNSELNIVRSIPYLMKLREIKSANEIKLIKKAVDISVKAHEEAIRNAKPGMFEYHVQAIMEYVFASEGAENSAYPSIVSSGINTCILHYQTNRAKIPEGSLVLMDCGAEFHGYASDITRAFPINGKFSHEQKQIYNIVLAALDSAIAGCAQGASFDDINKIVKKNLSDGLIKLGIINEVDELKEYFPHGCIHYIGLDVHDAGSRDELNPGSVIAVEPGIYIPEGSPCAQKWWNIGIRIEDNLLITENGNINLSEKLARTVEDIEKLMKSANEKIPSLLNNTGN